MFMASHGVTVIGPNVAWAFDDLYYLERAAMMQILAMSTGRPLKIIPDEICRTVRDQITADRQQAVSHLVAIRRILMHESPEFAE